MHQHSLLSVISQQCSASYGVLIAFSGAKADRQPKRLSNNSKRLRVYRSWQIQGQILRGSPKQPLKHHAQGQVGVLRPQAYSDAYRTRDMRTPSRLEEHKHKEDSKQIEYKGF